MREVRMTFGEHLDELRRRIIFALLYLTVGVVVCMAYGTELVDFALKPHYRALGAAQRNRLIGDMEGTLKKLEGLTSVNPDEVGQLSEWTELEGEEIHWEVLFVREVALPQLYRRLEIPFARLAARVENELSEVPEPARSRLAGWVGELGQEIARLLVSEFAPELELKDATKIPDRFRNLEERLARAEAAGSGGATRLQRLLGWGKDLSGVLQPLRRFLTFLERRREQVEQGEIPMETLREWAQDSRLPKEIDKVLSKLEEDATKVVEGIQPKIWVISYIESFSAYLKVALILGALLALPGILYEMWKFIGAGLYPHEQTYVVTILPFSLVLFVVGAAFGYFIMIPVGLEFLAGWGVENVELNFTLGSYISLFFTLTLILGLVFQTPLLMIFFAKIGVLNVPLYRKGRRVAVFVGVILAVVLTPPDPFSWSLMAIPMILLYEVGILACRVLVKPPKEA